MEMSGSCPRVIPAPRPVRGPHGGWQQQEIDLLARRVGEGAQAGQSLRNIFETVAGELGRKPNSIRNFYYAQLREREGDAQSRALPFETFSQDEVESLIRSVLTARAQGMSVRACVRKLSSGDKTRMLRYQNKYRSTVRTRPDLVERVMHGLEQEGIPFVSPYPTDGEEAARSAMPRIRSRADALGDAQLAGLFDGLDHLLDLALANHTPDPEEAKNTAFSKDSDALRKADRLSAQCDMLRIALSDEQERMQRLRQETGSMVTLIKEFIALPEQDRVCYAQGFCQQAAARLSAVECAMEFTP